MLAYMVRTTVKLADEVDARLRHEAERRGITLSSLVREAIEAHLGVRPGSRRFLSAGAGHSGRSDVSERIDEILAAELGASR
jgi:Ribbon-helix-helix protein, copG family